MTRTVDLMPTILDLLGIEPALDEMQGRSLVPYWTSPGEAPDQVAFTEALARPNEKKSLRTSRHKYILNVRPELVEEYGRATLPDRPLRAQLFDLETDPGERTNLLGDDRTPGAEEVAARLDRALRDHVAHSQGEAEPTRLDEETLERLKALGYLGP